MVIPELRPAHKIKLFCSLKEIILTKRVFYVKCFMCNSRVSKQHIFISAMTSSDFPLYFRL